MKLFCEKSTNIIIYAVDDGTNVEWEDGMLVFPDFRDGFFTEGDGGDVETNLQVYEDVSDLPENWTGRKYKYQNGQFVLNPDWIDPLLEEDPQ